jgi:hypothetical protein
MSVKDAIDAPCPCVCAWCPDCGAIRGHGQHRRWTLPARAATAEPLNTGLRVGGPKTLTQLAKDHRRARAAKDNAKD